MRFKGSITVFLSLILLVLLSLFSASLLSARLAADRMACANAADQAVFSLFSEYDRDLADLYHILFLDAGMDSGSLSAGAYVHFLEDSADYILHPEKGVLLPSGSTPLKVRLEECSLTGYTTAAQGGWAPLAAQAVRYMQDTLGVQGVQLLLSVGNENAPAQTQQSRQILSSDTGAEMKKIRENAAAARTEAGGAAQENPAADPASLSPETVKAGEEAEQTIDTIVRLKKRSVYSLVLRDPSSVSQKTVDLSSFPSRRNTEPGVGVFTMPEETGSVTGTLLFREYLLKHCGSFRSPSQGALSYQTEYLLHGKSSDEANLKAVIRSLLLIRIGINAASLAADASLKSQAQAAATAAAAVILSPEAEPLIESILIGGWAFCESIADVRALLSGKKNAPVKDSTNWQVPLSSIPLLLSDPDRLCKDAPGGIGYEGYLRILLGTARGDVLQKRFADIVESTVRTVKSRPSFRLDLCIDSAEALFLVRAEEMITFETKKSFSYRSDPG